MSRAARAWSRSKLGRRGVPELTPKQYFYAGYHAALEEVKWDKRAAELLAIAIQHDLQIEYIKWLDS